MRKALPVLFLLAGMSLYASPPVRKASPAKAKAPAQPATPFDLAWESIPSNFHPDDFTTVYATNKSRPRGEFERAEQYQSRLSVDTSRLYSFKVNLEPLQTLRYDADMQQFKMPFPIKSATIRNADVAPGYSEIGATYVTLRAATRTGGPDTVGSNAFGAKVVIEHRAKDVSGVTLHAGSTGGTNLYSDSAWSQLYSEAKNQGISIPVEQAKAAKDSLETLLVVRLAGDFNGQATLDGSTYSGATIDLPVALATKYKLIASDGAALVFYNKNTRQIYKKWILVKGNLSGDQGHKPSTLVPPQRETKSFAEVCADLKNTDPVVFQQMGCK